MAVKQHKSGKHPTTVTASDPLDQPVSAETAQKLVAHLGLSEGEAQAILAARPATAAEAHAAIKAELVALAGALGEDIAHAVATDPKLELGPGGDTFEAEAAHLRRFAGAVQKLESGAHDVHAAAQVGAGKLEVIVDHVVAEIRALARANANVARVYAPLLAYAHARYPGAHRRGSHLVAAPAQSPQV